MSVIIRLFLRLKLWLSKRRCLEPFRPAIWRWQHRIYMSAVNFRRFTRNPDFYTYHLVRKIGRLFVLKRNPVKHRLQAAREAIARKWQERSPWWKVQWHCLYLRLWGRHRIRWGARRANRSSKIVMLVRSYLPADPRVEREARALAAKGYQVKIICPQWEVTEKMHLAPIPDWGPGITFRILPFEAHAFFFEPPYVLGKEFLEAALEEKNVAAFHSHDLDTSLAVMIAAAHHRVPCVCDWHEWFSENVTWNVEKHCYEPHPPELRNTYRRIERLALRCATEVITVCDSIGRDLQSEFSTTRPIHIIRNIPIHDVNGLKHHQPMDLHQVLSLTRETKILLYQGGIGPSRNLEPIIRAMALVPNTVFVIRGPVLEAFEKEYYDLAEKSGCRDRLFCLPAVPSHHVVSEARSADMGIWTLLSNVGLNFQYALPNKIFEYLTAGIPILVADLPEARKLVETYQVGLWFDPDDPKSIAEAITKMTTDTELYHRLQQNIPATLKDLNGEQEWQKLVKLYQAIVVPGDPPEPLSVLHGDAPSSTVFRRSA